MHTNKLSKKSLKEFQTIVWDYYKVFGRTFVWRKTTNSYHIVVSEIMLQQTQTYRVEGKFEAFIEKFPNFEVLAHAPLREVLAAWQGLGYNRRAMALQKTAQKISDEFGGTLPNDPEALVSFPGIGKATAASICAFAFNKPTIFIETNIRAVFIHFFFFDKTDIHDDEIFPLIKKTVDNLNAREWYYALMDYGVMLKKKFKNPSRKSKHHTVQSKFEGSDRQIRGMILKALTDIPELSYTDLISFIRRWQFIAKKKSRETRRSLGEGWVNRDEQRVQKILFELQQEGFIVQNNDFFQITT